MKLEFDSIDEVKAFYAQLKGTRGKKGDDDAPETSQTTVQVPAPLQPPVTHAPFNPQQATGFTAPAASGFPGAPVVDPAVQGLVDRIVTRADTLLKSGQGNAEQMLTWFRSQCGPEAAQATMDQIKTVFLPKASTTLLDQIAKLTGA